MSFSIIDSTNYIIAALNTKADNPLNTSLDLNGNDAFDINAIELNIISTPVASSAGTSKIYVNQIDGKLHIINSSGTDVLVGDGGDSFDQALNTTDSVSFNQITSTTDVNVNGSLLSDDIDSITASPITIGATTATGVNISRTGQTTTVNDRMDVLGSLYFTGGNNPIIEFDLVSPIARIGYNRPDNRIFLQADSLNFNGVSEFGVDLVNIGTTGYKLPNNRTGAADGSAWVYNDAENAVEFTTLQISNVSGLQTEVDTLETINNTITSYKYLGITNLTSIGILIPPGGVNYRIPDYSYTMGGVLDTVDVHMGQAGDLNVYTYFLDTETNTFTVSDSTTFSLGIGYSYGLVVDLEIPTGGYVGMFSDSISITETSVLPQWYTGLYIGVTENFVKGSPITAGASAMITFNTSEIVDFSENLNNAVNQVESGVGVNALSEPKYIYMGATGQSNISGAVAASNRQEYGALGFGNSLTVVEPLKSGTAGDGVGTTAFPGFGFASKLRYDMMKNLLPSNSTGLNPIVVGRNGISGTELKLLIKGTSVYTDGQNQLQTTVNLAGGGNIIQLGQILFQGEKDSVIGTARDVYKAQLIDLATTYDSDSRQILNGIEQRRTYVVQINSFPTSGTADTGWEISMAQFEAAQENELVSIACPSYMATWDDDRHVDEAGSRLIGAYCARAANNKATFEPLMVVDSYISGSVIYLIYNKASVAIDTVSIAAQTNNGFDIYFDGVRDDGAIGVAAVDNVIQITPTVALTGVCTFRYGYLNGVPAVGGYPVGYNGGSGNIRDNSGVNDVFDGIDLHNWAVFQEGTVL